MAEKPTKPTGDFAYKDYNYCSNGLYEAMTESEFKQGRNNTGEVETSLGSLPDARKDNYIFRYLTAQINYLTKMVEYLDQKSGG